METRNLKLGLGLEGWKLETRNLKLGVLDLKTVCELDVYQLSEKLSDMVWFDYDQWSEKARKTMGLQTIRSADSIAANISEGYGRYTPPDRKKFYLYARGSLEETKTWLRKATRRKVINTERSEEYATVLNELGPKLNAFIKSTKVEVL